MEQQQVITAMCTIRDFGAVGDGKTDDTAAIQSALNAAAETNGTVFVPEGTYCCSEIKLPPHTGLVGNATWGYRGDKSGSVLKLNRDDATCLINITGAIGSTLNGLLLQGGNLGKGIHGILLSRDPNRKEEETQRIERCQVTHFSGDGIRLETAWCFSLRGCHSAFNHGDGLSLGGYDGFILDNWFSGNQGAGIASRGGSASITVTGNRIEWNRDGGILLRGASYYNITGNYIDRSGNAGIIMLPGEAENPADAFPCVCMTVTGNVIYRSGKPEWTDATDPNASAHIRMERAHGVTCIGNTMCVGQDDGGGRNSPASSMVLRNLKNCIVKDNVMHIGSLKELVRDLGEHEEGVIIKDNVGSLYVETKPDLRIWGSGQM